MEQRWTVDRYDVPSGDLEFWAMRRGKVPHAVEPERLRLRASLPAAIMMRIGLAVLVAVAVGIALA